MQRGLGCSLYLHNQLASLILNRTIYQVRIRSLNVITMIMPGTEIVQG